MIYVQPVRHGLNLSLQQSFSKVPCYKSLWSSKISVNFSHDATQTNQVITERVRKMMKVLEIPEEGTGDEMYKAFCKAVYGGYGKTSTVRTPIVMSGYHGELEVSGDGEQLPDTGCFFVCGDSGKAGDGR